MGKGYGSGCRPAMTMATASSATRGILDALDRDLQELLPIDADVEYSCDDGGCESICRCGRVVGVSSHRRIVANDLLEPLLADLELPAYEPGEPLAVQHARADAYAYGRIVSRLIPSTEDLEWSSIGGYYGETLLSVRLSSEQRAQIEAGISEYRATGFDEAERGLGDKLRYALAEEYGHVLPRLTDAVFRIEPVDVVAVQRPAKRHVKHLDREQVDGYRSSLRHPTERALALPHLVVVRRGSGDRLVDGYHRQAALARLAHESVGPSPWRHPLAWVADLDA